MIIKKVDYEVQHRFDGMRDEAKNRGGMWDTRNFKCGMKTERRDRDMLRFVGGIWGRTGICEIIS